MTPISASLETAAPLVLPFGTATYSGVLDFSAVAPGSYVLNAMLRYSGEEVGERLPISVTVADDGARIVTILDAGAAPPQDAGGR